jgi:outer membrane protein OmpA-like peptidoglycan-associated protein
MTKTATRGAEAGGIIGLWASGAIGAATLPLTAGGIVVGGGIGILMRNTYHLLDILQRDGVQVIQYGDTLRIIIPSDRLFEFDSANIYPYAPRILDNVLIFLSRYGIAPIVINAYTDDVLSPRASLALTRMQAKAIAGYLWTHGIPFDKVNPMGMGSSDPIATNGNSRGSAYNRRIELVLPVVAIPLHGHSD